MSDENDVKPHDHALPLHFNPDDDRIAVLFTDAQKGRIAYFHNGWHTYENGVWVDMASQELKYALLIFLRPLRSSGVKVSAGQVNALHGLLESYFYTPDRKLIALAHEQKHYIPLRNGLFNLETMQLEPHNPELFFTVQLDFDYDPEADYPTWGKFLRSSMVHPNGKTDSHMIQLFQEALGYSMTARTDLKASFWLVGEKNSGKSTLIAAIRHLMGSLETPIDLNQLGTNNFLLAEVIDKRIVTFTEADSNVALPDALYKAMVGGEDAIYANVKHKPAISFIPQFKVWWAMNEAPRVLDRSGATIDRIKVFLFNRTVPQEERILGLGKQLQKERAGLFNWAMKGYTALVNRGKFMDCAQSERWLENFALENDTERTYALERWVYDADMMMQAQYLYDDYRNWCEANGSKPKSHNQIQKEWERLGLKKVKRNTGNFWQGARINDGQKLI